MLRRSSVFLSSWRDNGISYLKYLNVCTETLHKTVSDKHRSKYERWSTPNYTTVKPDTSGGVEVVSTVPAFSKDY